MNALHNEERLKGFLFFRKLQDHGFSRRFSTSRLHLKRHQSRQNSYHDLRKNKFLRNTITLQAAAFLRNNLCDSESSCTQMVASLEVGKKKKKLFDASVALLTLFFLSPLIALIALAIKLESKGPVFFAQYRTGYMGRRFKMYKFRTMVEKAEFMKEKVQHLSFHASKSPDFKIKNDPRITRIGNFLRKSSLDEIPQLWNVVLGDMRLVGPRPTSFSADTYAPKHLPRLLAFPGLTGIWQISGRSNIPFDERVKMDCQYILNYTFLLDLKIMIKTPLAVVRGNGAY